jgi:hypothetical protein
VEPFYRGHEIRFVCEPLLKEPERLEASADRAPMPNIK